MSTKYAESYSVIDIQPGTVTHKKPPVRGKTRHSDLSPVELKNLVVIYAGGSPEIMSRMTGVNAAYIVRVIRGQINCSWVKADHLRSVKHVKKEPTVIDVVTVIPPSKLASLHPTMRSAVEGLIANGKLMTCLYCRDYFMRDDKHHSYCPPCKTAKRVVVPSAKPAKAKPIHTVTQSKREKIHQRQFINCGNTVCTRKLRDWNGRKYCSNTCKSKVAHSVRTGRKRGQEAPQATQKPAPTKPAATMTKREDGTGTLQKPTGAATPKQQKVKGDYIAYEGAPCHIDSCGGSFMLKPSRYGKFFGCSWFTDSNRPPNTDRCRATALWASNVDGKTLQPYQGISDAVQRAPVTETVGAITGMGEGAAILNELRLISSEVRDAVARVTSLEASVKANTTLVKTNLSATQHVCAYISSIAEQVNKIHSDLA